MAKPRTWTDDKIAELARLIERKATPTRAAALMGVSPSAIRRVARDYGLTFQVRG